MCKFSYYVYVSMPPISGWILAIFSVDKAASVLNVRNTKKFEFIRDRRFPLVAIASIVLINLVMYITVPIYLNSSRTETIISSSNETNTTKVTYACYINTVSIIRVLNYLFLIESSLLPFSVMLSATFCISKFLYMSRNKVLPQESRSVKNRKIRDRKFALTSSVFNILYVIFQVPIVLTYLISVPDIMTYYFFYLSAVTALNMNFAMPFFVYVITNSIFRRELMKLVGLRSSRSDSKYTGKSQTVTNKH